MKCPQASSMRFRARRLALQCLAGAAATAAVAGGGLLLLRLYKRRHPPAGRGQGNVAEVYGKPFQPITTASLAKDVESCRQQQKRKLLGLGVPASAAQAAADAAAAVTACEILGGSWAEEVAVACPHLGPASALLAASKSGAPVELHMHLKAVFRTALKAALLCDLAALVVQQEKREREQLLHKDADMHWLLSETEDIFKDTFYEPAIRAAASACDFAQPARELLQRLQQISTIEKGSSFSPTESLLPLLLTEKGKDALEAFIAAVDKQVLASLCNSWERSGVLQTHQEPQQREHEGPPARVRQLSARSTGKDAGTPMALSSYADVVDRCTADVHTKVPPSAPLFLRASDVKAARAVIEKHGFVVIKNALTSEQLQEVQEVTFAASETASEGGLKMKEFDPNIFCTRPTYGARGGIPIRFAIVSEEAHAVLCPDYCVCSRLFVSEMQTVNADALALSQPWHRDNSYRGLTVVLPLVPISPSNGPTELLPGSHVLSGEEGDSWFQWLRSLPTFLKTSIAGGSTVKAEIQPGDALVYDSRLLHRGQANETWHPRPTLILRYDYKETPPPGKYTNVLRSLGASAFGRAVGGFLNMYEKL
ncbi:hypothetical protein, conserved [Eimeria brunetti]|uniref:Uncharacterized protein n=1 Tax=Eimeria brunetti TaxID=51314 RepID=U6LV56_9EIME|nr:hypothetical protein, conserved [Eimeria brunetti]